MIHRFIAAIALGTLALAGTAVAQEKAAKPLNIVVYGGSGNIGSRIVNEAAARGHNVTVVDKSPKPDIAPKGVKVVTGDVFDKQDILKNIAGADALVSSIVLRPAPTPDFALSVVKSEVEALRAQTGAKKTRLLVVGGGSSLYGADGKRIIERFGGRQDGEVKSSVDSVDWLKAEVKDVQWSFFSPNGNFSPGKRTGVYRYGTDKVIVDASGRSAISYEDYAVAMIDEIEKPQFINKHFTAGY
ncbi:MAG: NAD(P)H-binding protein [Pseudomonadota bacterium]